MSESIAITQDSPSRDANLGPGGNYPPIRKHIALGSDLHLQRAHYWWMYAQAFLDGGYKVRDATGLGVGNDLACCAITRNTGHFELSPEASDHDGVGTNPEDGSTEGSCDGIGSSDTGRILELIIPRL